MSSHSQNRVSHARPNEAAPFSALSRVQRQDLIRLVMSIAEQMRNTLHLSASTPVSGADTRIPTHFYHPAMRSFDAWREEVLVRIRDALEVSVPKVADGRLGVDPHDHSFLHAHYPPIATTLVPFGRSEAIMESLLMLLLSLKSYDARSRVLLLHVASSLSLPLKMVLDLEAKTAKSLLATGKMNADAESALREEASRSANRWKIGFASAAGAALIGITGGLAAPVVAGGIAALTQSVGLGAVAGFFGVAGSSPIVAALFGAYGGIMGGQVMERYAKEVEDFKFIPVDDSSEPRLRVGVAVTGWIVDGEEEVVDPWRSVGGGLEAYALRWELAALTDLGVSLSGILTSTAMSWLKLELAKLTFSAALYSIIWPLAMLQTARVVDNPFSIAKHRAGKAGLVLADAIINKAQGNRPITLVGYSLGARVIYSCLRSLAKRDAFGLVENVVLMGAPVPADDAEWREMRSIVAGRLVNVYSEQDYVLAFLYRMSSVQMGVAGLQRIELEGVENVDKGKLVSGHLMYRHAVGRILKDLLVGDMVLEVVEQQEVTLKALIEQEERAADKTIKMVENDLELEAQKEMSDGGRRGVRPPGYEETGSLETIETLDIRQQNCPGKNLTPIRHPLDSGVGDLQQLEARTCVIGFTHEPEVKQQELDERSAIPEEHRAMPEDSARDMDAVLSRVEAKLAAMRLKRRGAKWY